MTCLVACSSMPDKNDILLKPVKTKTGLRPESTIDKKGTIHTPFSNWHWRKYLSDHMPLEDWELDELGMTPEEASEEIRKFDR